ncbi:Uncharacterised protein [Mycobacteroides abscessus subsp. abscessus]|nr:Uncharacterised protein [Mycobacteroides abscessus subsp. abscessus]
MQLGLVRIVGKGRRVVLGDDGNVVGGDTQLVQRAGQIRILAAASGRQCTQARSRDGGVYTVTE